MKKIYLILSVLLIVFPSCETDFDVSAEWEEITVVYGLLDQSQDRQYIKINKAYLGAGDALQMADIADSINFLDSLVVRLHKTHPLGDTLSTITFYDTIIEKEDGIFSTDNNIIYTARNKDALTTDLISDENFFADEGVYVYALTIENIESGNLVSANTGIISTAKPWFPSTEQVFSINAASIIKFYDPILEDSLRFLVKKIQWRETDNGAIYQVDIKLNYTETENSNTINRHLIWKQPMVGNSPQMSTLLQGAKFFNFLRNNIDENNEVSREFLSLDVILTIGTSDLGTYIERNEPYEGVVQERPSFSNINNGIGLFSSRYIYRLLGVQISDDTQDYLKDELNLNFQ